jgi:16S rRNA (uracil1498-N3)-methyltransferase
VPRLFVPATRIADGRARLTPADVRHLRALRLAGGSRLTVVDDRGREHDAVVVRLGPRGAELEIRAARPGGCVTAGPPIVLLAGVLKGARMDVLVEKATELGVSRIVPVVTRFTVARPREDARGRFERWRRIAIAATTQCGRPSVPAIASPTSFGAALDAELGTDALGILFWEERRRMPLARIRADRPAPATLVVAVGPEGGFAASEVNDARARGFAVSGLGPRLLRAETAAIVALALCQSLWGDLGEPR